MSHLFAFATVLLASSLSTAAALAATTVQSVHVGARAGVYLGDQFVDQQQSVSPDPAGIIGSTIGLRASASTRLTLGDADAGSFALSTGIWESADKGSILLSWGWNVASAGVDTTVISSGISNWTYTFTAGADGFFNSSYRIFTRGTTNPTGLLPLQTSDDWTSGYLGVFDTDPSGEGTTSIALLAGQTYTMGLYNQGFFGNRNGFDFLLANGEGRVDWEIVYSPIPEPGTWALMLAGLAAVCGVAGRRRFQDRRKHEEV